MFRTAQKQATPYLQAAKQNLSHLCSRDATAADISTAATAVCALMTVTNYFAGAGVLSTTIALLSTTTFGISAYQQGGLTTLASNITDRFFNQQRKAMPMTDATATNSINGPKKS